jgi:hypothetical protein
MAFLKVCIKRIAKCLKTLTYNPDPSLFILYMPTPREIFFYFISLPWSRKKESISTLPSLIVYSVV